MYVNRMADVKKDAENKEQGRAAFGTLKTSEIDPNERTINTENENSSHKPSMSIHSSTSEENSENENFEFGSYYEAKNDELKNNSETKKQYGTESESQDVSSQNTPVNENPLLNTEGSDKTLDSERNQTPLLLRASDDSLKDASLHASINADPKIYLSYWDCGGDDDYHATHHIHLSSDAVYVLVFKMTSMISDDCKYTYRKKKLPL